MPNKNLALCTKDIYTKFSKGPKGSTNTAQEKKRVISGMKYKIVNRDFLPNTHKVNIINNVRV